MISPVRGECLQVGLEIGGKSEESAARSILGDVTSPAFDACSLNSRHGETDEWKESFECHINPRRQDQSVLLPHSASPYLCL